MNNCPDPTKIYVDPDQGYVCGKNPDANTIEEFKNAWVAQCEKVSHPVGPDTNPCQPPEIDDPCRYIKAHMPSVCGPNAHPDFPEACIVKVKLETHYFGEVTLQELAVFRLNKFGGPIFVLPPKGEALERACAAHVGIAASPAGLACIHPFNLHAQRNALLIASRSYRRR
jgi:hypothetical protein